MNFHPQHAGDDCYRITSGSGLLPADRGFPEKNHSWIVYGVPATVAFSSVLLFSVISFKQKRLWGWLALVFIATLGMSGWLKWQTDGMNPRRAEKALWDFGCYLLLMAMLLLPWIQQSLRIRNDSSRYRYFTSQYGITYLYYW